MMDAILTNTLLPEISWHILIEKMEGRPIGKTHMGVENDEFNYNFS
ncbi:MAG: hypothetical protein KZQ86_04235 [Candidatus Thiodiazotropha sp. (ex Lucinoma kastoroae)]|nr:hypothetical protein [Candidatus Thiodiazotropha sp. (ex Rostrolucina anterorostrata)]MCU7859039.1 hypothetical protein [Candidatus Thiodiazotropha sp. (ex Lucinoma kastoroae)]